MSTRPYRIAAIAVVMAAIIGLYFFRAARIGRTIVWDNEYRNSVEYYNYLTDAFLAGRLSLLIPPDPKLLALDDPYNSVANGPYRLHDASLFEGKYYLYFGPTPALTLFLPYRVIFGSHLPDYLAVPAFCSTGFLFLCALLFLIGKQENWQPPLHLELALVVLLGLGTLVPYLMKRPAYYEVAIAAGYCFTAAAFFFLALALRREHSWRPGTLFSGVCFGLSLGCRPQFVIPAVLICALLAKYMMQGRFDLRPLAQAPFLSFVLSIAAMGALLLGYNYARFHSPQEFGQTYGLSGDNNDRFELRLSHLVPSLYYFLFRIIGAAPVIVLSILWPELILLGRAPGISSLTRCTRLIVALLVANSASLLFFICLTGWVNGRYCVDIAPSVMLLTCIAGLSLWNSCGLIWRAVLGAAVSLAACWSAVIGILISRRVR